MQVPEEIKYYINSGQARQKYGLRTDQDSQYHSLRVRGYSDVEAQYKVFKRRGIF